MRGRFNYLMFFIRITFCLLFAMGALWSITWLVLQWMSGSPELAGVGKQLVGIILFFYVAFKLGQASWYQRFTIALAEDRIIVGDVFLFKRRILQLNDIKGFSLMEYPTYWVKGKSIILYLTDGNMIEFPEFLFFNFKKLDKALEESGLQFFGIESREWRWRKLE